MGSLRRGVVCPGCRRKFKTLTLYVRHDITEHQGLGRARLFHDVFCTPGNWCICHLPLYLKEKENV